MHSVLISSVMAPREGLVFPAAPLTALPAAAHRNERSPLRPRPKVSRLNEHLLNTTRKCYRNRGQVLPLIGRTLAWVDEGVSFRELNLSEMIAHRAKQVINSAHLTVANDIPNVVWEPPAQERTYSFLRHRYQLLKQTQRMFCKCEDCAKLPPVQEQYGAAQ
jgi:hypothetical protein